MKAITVKYIADVTGRGSRLKAFDLDGNSVTIPYPHELDRAAKYRSAAQALADKMGWKGSLVSGEIKGAEVFVFAEPVETYRLALADCVKQMEQVMRESLPEYLQAPFMNAIIGGRNVLEGRLPNVSEWAAAHPEAKL